MSPPEREKPAPPQSRPSPNDTNTAESTAYVRQLRLRRDAARRICGGDPWRWEPVSTGYSQAVMHLIGLGLLPAPNRDALRTMHRAGGCYRRAATLVGERWELTQSFTQIVTENQLTPANPQQTQQSEEK